MKVSILNILLFVHLGMGVFAQNLVPNPGFEDLKVLPEAEAEVGKLQHWLNPNKASTRSVHFAAADFLHQQGKGLSKIPSEHFGKITPFHGLATVGLMTFNKLLPDFREYITVRLKKPLDTALEYRLVFHVNSGSGTPYGRFATRFGALFSNQIPFQGSNIQQKPQLETEEPLTNTQWEKVFFTFKPDSNYQYLTLGNFRDDLNTYPQMVSQQGNPCAYYFLDEISVEEIIPPKPNPIDSTANAAEAVLNKIQAQVQGRRIAKQQVVEVNTQYLEIKIWDDREEDDDQVSLNLNGDWIIENYTTSKRPLELKLPLMAGQENFLILFAHSLGSKPPNTAAISLKDKDGKTRKLVLKSDLQSCGAIEIICMP